MNRHRCPQQDTPCPRCDAEAERRKDDREQPDDWPNELDYSWPIGKAY